MNNLAFCFWRFVWSLVTCSYFSGRRKICAAVWASKRKTAKCSGNFAAYIRNINIPSTSSVIIGKSPSCYN